MCCTFPADPEEDSFCFWPGEQLLCEASTVLKYVQEDSCQRGIYGKLVCTDFKIAFLGDDESALGNDVRLSCIWLSLGEQCGRGPTVLFPQRLNSSMHSTHRPEGQKSPPLVCAQSFRLSFQWQDHSAVSHSCLLSHWLVSDFIGGHSQLFCTFFYVSSQCISLIRIIALQIYQFPFSLL